MSLHFLISFQAKQQNLQAFSELLQQVKTELPKVSGCTGVTVLSSQEDPSLFTLIEIWESREHHQANSAKLIESGDWNVILGLLTREPVGTYYNE